MSVRTLALWSAPRSRSTAFLRMMVERGDFTVLHEPFSHVMDFGVTSVGGQDVRSETELISAILSLARNGPVFFKDTTDFHYPGVLTNERFLRSVQHTFLIRDPAAIIASHFALTPDLGCADVGIQRLAEIHDAVAACTGVQPVVIAAEDLVRAPKPTLDAYFAAVGLDFLPHALSWRPGMLRQWQGTSRWHLSTSRSDGFTDRSATYPDTVHNNPRLAAYFEHHEPFYRKLFEQRLVIAD